MGVPDALASLFYLAGALLWLEFLQSENWVAYAASVAALVAAFLSKEMAATLPAFYFLIDRGFVRKPASLTRLVKRYLPLAFIALVYAALDYTAVARGAYTRDWGYGVGVNNLNVLLSYLGQMAIPWKLDSPWSYIWLLLGAAATAYALFRREFRVLVFAAIAVLIVLPVVPFAPSMRATVLPLDGLRRRRRARP